MPHPVTRLIPFAIVLAAGCGESPPSPTTAPNPAVAEPKPPTAPPTVTEIDVTEERLALDPATVRLADRKTLGIGLGSATVEILNRADGLCTFEYTFEIEGGYTRYHVEVPTDGGPVEIRAQPDPAEVSTSFDLQRAKIVGSGNLLLP